jgi:hypothetical protein
VTEAAGAADVDPQVVTAAESEQEVHDADRERVDSLIATLIADSLGVDAEETAGTSLCCPRHCR